MLPGDPLYMPRHRQTGRPGGGRGLLLLRLGTCWQGCRDLTARDAGNHDALGEGSTPPQGAGAPDAHGGLGSAARGANTHGSTVRNPPRRRSAPVRSGPTTDPAPQATQRGRQPTRSSRNLSSGAFTWPLRRRCLGRRRRRCGLASLRWRCRFVVRRRLPAGRGFLAGLRLGRRCFGTSR